MTLRNRLARLERTAPPRADDPAVLIIRDGQQMALIGGQWRPWPDGASLPASCKSYGFDPDEHVQVVKTLRGVSMDDL